MLEPIEVTVEKRERVMVSSTGNAAPTPKAAHILNPTHASTNESLVPENPLTFSSSLPSRLKAKAFPVKVTFKGWQGPSAKWVSWVRHLEGEYQSVWKRAGIYEAIFSSTFNFQRDNDLILGLAEKWCPDTNTFIFPWAEATLTLEDMIILGGYSVLGSSVFSCSTESKELEKIENKLKEARTELENGPLRKASQDGWTKMFMRSCSEMEHEAFLSSWLDVFVFNDSDGLIQARVFPIATHLAKGEVVALAPAVLAGIYRDLGLLKATILAATEIKMNDANKLALTLRSPLHLVQLWAWERFPALQPVPNSINDGDPRSALWEKVKVKKVENVRLAFDSAAETFHWRPYATGMHKVHFYKFYKEKGERFHLGSHQDLLAYALCLRVSELVGLDCIERYLPHRVARQFGSDQDIPCDIPRANECPEFAWFNYIRPFSDAQLFVPSQFFKPEVTIRYLRWWKQTELGPPDILENANVIRRKRSSRSISKRVPQAWTVKEGYNTTDVFLNPSPNCYTGNSDATDVYSRPTQDKMLKSCDMKKSINMEQCREFVYSAGQSPRICNVNANNEAEGDINSSEKHVESIVRVDAAKVTTLEEQEETTDIEAGIPISSAQSGRNVCEGESIEHNVEIPGLVALEARIAVVEKSMAKLKAARVESRFGRKST